MQIDQSCYPTPESFPWFVRLPRIQHALHLVACVAPSPKGDALRSPRRGADIYARYYAGTRIREGMRNARHVWWNLGRGGLALPDTFYSSPWISSVFRRREHLRVVRWVAVSCAVIPPRMSYWSWMSKLSSRQWCFCDNADFATIATIVLSRHLLDVVILRQWRSGDNGAFVTMVRFCDCGGFASRLAL